MLLTKGARHMKGFVASILVLFFAVVLTGMGELGGGPSGTVPETTENINARVFDRMGIMAELTQFSMEGNVFLEGTSGKGEITIPFKNLKSIEFGEIIGQDMFVSVQLKSGETLPLKVTKKAVFYGDTGYGAYRIRVRDIKRVEFP